MIGWFTPTEAGAVGAAGALFFSLIRRRLSWPDFRKAVRETVKTTGMLYVIMIGAYVFMYFITVTNIPFFLADFVGGLNLPPRAVMGVILLMYFILGCFMDAMSMVLITIPIFLPVADSLGFGPIWFGIIVVRVMEMAMVTPPMGLMVYTISGMFDIPIQTAFRGVLPFIVADICHVLLLMFVPGVVLWLPSLM